ncbi:MAG: LamG-like jellyroll fold domain-containing protein [Planctomycetota bacterium]|jgi:hypothetical protein
MCRRLSFLVCSILVLGLVLTSVAQAGLVAWWRFEEGSGGTAEDSSGNGHHGTLLGTPEWVLGPEGFGGALAFNPDRCTGVDCGIFDPTNGTGQFTVALWAFWDGTGTSMHFLTKSNGWGADTMMFQVELWGAITNPAEIDRVGLSYQGNISSYTSSSGSTPFSIMPKNQWVHLAFTFDGINATVYLNGVDEEGPKPFSIGPNIDAMVEIGYNSNRPTVNERTFHGTLDEIRLYDRPLSEQDVQTLIVGGEINTGAAALPKPGNRAIEVLQDVVLGWMAGDYADTHDVYFGTVFDDINDAGRDNDPTGVLVSQNQAETTYEPPGLLKFGQTYYWRVDEFNDLNPKSPWKGNVWSFQIINYSIVDAFESYNDLDPTDPNSNRIFNTWIDGFEQPANGAVVGYAAPPFAEQTIVNRGKQSMPLFYDNSGTATYSEAQRTFSPVQDWTREGVETLSLWFRGNRAYVGSFVEAPPGTYTMTASGIDIWATADEFHFAYKELSGAGAIIAKVDSLQNTDPWAKAGVMIRNTLEPGSRYAAVLVTPENGVRFQYRRTADTITRRYFAEGITAPQWVRLESTTGGLIRAFYSADGTTWTNFNLVQVRMDTPAYIGLAVTSTNVEAACEAKFSNVSFGNSSVGPQWTDQDVGMLSNDVAPMYVTVGDGSGTTATVYHADPSASQIGDWMEWNIPLTNFSVQGVVLTDVSKLAIGFGGADNPQPGGSGLMYFDDIRLYLFREPEIPGVVTEEEIIINIDKDFEYVPQGWPLGLSVSQTPAVGLSAKPYEALGKESEYGSGQVLYGYIPLGNSNDANISFAVDTSSINNWVLYVDTNNNEDLTDDGPPRENEGTGKLAALISLHVEVISASGETIVRPYQLWFWLTESEFPRFYTRCHYRSQIPIGEEQYTAIAYEFKNHDALYQESGLWIDLNRDGKLNESEEHFQDGAIISVRGKQYILRLNYP